MFPQRSLPPACRSRCRRLQRLEGLLFSTTKNTWYAPCLNHNEKCRTTTDRDQEIDMTTPSIQTLFTEPTVRLPLVDRSVAELITVLNRPVSNYSHIIERLSPELAARFLETANTVQPHRQVTSLSYAVQLLGYGHMKRILISSILVDHFTRNPPDFDFLRFQTQSLFCAVLSRMIGSILEYDRPEELFTAGILHNIGKQIIAVHLQGDHRRILRLKSEEDLSTAEAEQRVLGMTHADIGAVALERFNIPTPICEAVRCHNVPMGQLPPYPDGTLARIVHTASRIVTTYALPDAFPVRTLDRRMQKDIDLRKDEYRTYLVEAVRTVGYHKSFPRLLERVAQGVAVDLRKYMRQRTERLFCGSGAVQAG